jgi:hypothetical protein
MEATVKRISLTRLALTAAITAYRALPAGVKHPCPRAGATCSELGLKAVRGGAGLAGVLDVVGSCEPEAGKHSPTCDFPAALLAVTR